MIQLKALIGSSVKDLRDMFDKIKINVRALKITGIHEDQVGPLLIPIVLYYVLPIISNVIRLQISHHTSLCSPNYGNNVTGDSAITCLIKNNTSVLL